MVGCSFGVDIVGEGMVSGFFCEDLVFSWKDSVFFVFCLYFVLGRVVGFLDVREKIFGLGEFIVGFLLVEIIFKYKRGVFLRRVYCYLLGVGWGILFLVKIFVFVCLVVLFISLGFG